LPLNKAAVTQQGKHGRHHLPLNNCYRLHMPLNKENTVVTICRSTKPLLPNKENTVVTICRSTTVTVSMCR
jgi:hypothetical protein